MESFIHFFITSRPNIKLKFSNISQVPIEATDSDMKIYLTSKIGKNSRLTGFTTKNPQLKEDIINSITQKADKM